MRRLGYMPAGHRARSYLQPGGDQNAVTYFGKAAFLVRFRPFAQIPVLRRCFRHIAQLPTPSDLNRKTQIVCGISTARSPAPYIQFQKEMQLSRHIMHPFGPGRRSSAIPKRITGAPGAAAPSRRRVSTRFLPDERAEVVPSKPSAVPDKNRNVLIAVGNTAADTQQAIDWTLSNLVRQGAVPGEGGQALRLGDNVGRQFIFGYLCI